jgi:hypothetical protein
MQNTESECLALDELIEEIDEDMVPVVFESFVEDTGGAVDAISNCIEQRDAEKLRKLSHRLKGCFISIKAYKAASIAKELEESGQKSQFDGLDVHLVDLKSEYSKVVSYIDRYMSAIVESGG